MRAHDLIRRPAYDRTGRSLGRVIDVVVELDQAGVPRVSAVVVGNGWHGRLLGYERPRARGPWLLDRIARRLSRGRRTVPWTDIRLDAARQHR